ncbi:hypothetical protein [Roseovarius sp. MMSF_3281]|uniref:hypothetical protein n=1 Tax=Roseovarius sp. MMSF_3281 TaxID=3046694 RepID=UPI00273DD757|nr:hypothetical protein [Roseovarius sp. MMSF_3281]
MSKVTKPSQYTRYSSAKDGSWQCKREAKTGRFVTVKNASKITKGVVKASASKRSAALIRLADR